MTSKPLKNFYKIIPKKYLGETRTYPNYDIMQLKLAFRMLIIGATGAGKTNALMNIWTEINAFDKIYLIAKVLKEPLYEWFIDTIREVEKITKKEILFVAQNLDELPDVDSMDKKHNNLIIIDDQIAEKKSKLETLQDFFIRGRKQEASVIFISQSYFKIPITIRQNVEYLAIVKLRNKSDLRRILNDISLDVPLEEVYRKLRIALRNADEMNLFLVDLTTPNPRLQFRMNFEPWPEDDMRDPAELESKERKQTKVLSPIQELAASKLADYYGGPKRMEERKKKRITLPEYPSHLYEEPHAPRSPPVSKLTFGGRASMIDDILYAEPSHHTFGGGTKVSLLTEDSRDASRPYTPESRQAEVSAKFHRLLGIDRLF